MKEKANISKEVVEHFVEFVISLHGRVITSSGGEHGVRDPGGLYNSCYKIIRYQSLHLTDPPAIGAFVYDELSRRHHFSDGNKRISHVLAKLLLLLSRYHLKINYPDAVVFIIRIAEFNSTVSFKEITEWIKEHSEPFTDKNITKYLKHLFDF